MPRLVHGLVVASTMRAMLHQNALRLVPTPTLTAAIAALVVATGSAAPVVATVV